MSEVKYTGSANTSMNIQGITLDLATADIPFDEGDIFTMIQNTEAMKLAEGNCKLIKGML